LLDHDAPTRLRLVPGKERLYGLVIAVTKLRRKAEASPTAEDSPMSCNLLTRPILIVRMRTEDFTSHPRPLNDA